MRYLRAPSCRLQSEMPVVRNEYEWYENESWAALEKEIWAAAYIAHPYHHPIIGWKSDIENVPIERLRKFYDDFYWPNNATLTIVGSFDTLTVFAAIRTHFGVHPASQEPIPTMYTEEPVQEGPRRVVLKRAGNPVVSIAHKIPSALHADMPALLVLASVLYEDKTSRLYKAFIDSALATDIMVSCNQTRDPSLFQTSVTLAPSTPHQKAEQVAHKEYERIANDGISSAELTAAKRAARVYAARRKDGPYALLSAINEDIASGDWTNFVRLPGAIEGVTVRDVKRVAQTYLVDDQMTVGWFVNAVA